MAEERKDSFAETVDTAASAAHTVKGAIKAGKAISGAAKGAAAGGPYGAVAGAVWAGRKHIGKPSTMPSVAVFIRFSLILYFQIRKRNHGINATPKPTATAVSRFCAG